MTRIERKQNERLTKKNNVKYSLSEMNLIIKSEVEKMQKEIHDKARRYAIRDLSAVFMDALYLQHGFGKKRIIRLFKRMNDMFVCINKGKVSIDDIIEQVEKDTKIDFRMIYQEENR